MTITTERIDWENMVVACRCQSCNMSHSIYLTDTMFMISMPPGKPNVYNLPTLESAVKYLKEVGCASERNRTYA